MRIIVNWRVNFTVFGYFKDYFKDYYCDILYT